MICIHHYGTIWIIFTALKNPLCSAIPLLLFLVTNDVTPDSNHSLYYLLYSEEKLIARVGDWVGRGHFAWEFPGHLTAPFGGQAMPSQHQSYSIGWEAGREERRWSP